MKQTTFLIIFFLLCSNFLNGQIEEKKNYFPIWTFHQKNINIHGLSIGLASLGAIDKGQYQTNTNGIKIELIGLGILGALGPNPIARNDSSFSELAKIPFSEIINGISLSGTGTVCHSLTNGITAGLICQFNFQVNGISFSIINYAQKHNGLQIAWINNCYYMNGVQFGILNYSSKTNGIQIGGFNNGLQTVGLQIGLFNESNDLKGLQIGLWNVNQTRKLPLINWNF